MPINRPVKEVGISLKFDADVKEAQKQMNLLLNDLNKLSTSALKQSAISGNNSALKQSSDAALELQQNLAKAFNTKTGKLDISNFAASLSKSGKDLAYYRENLARLGPEGNKAFLQVSKAVSSASTPVLQINEKMSQFLTTLKNTAKWQISSSILHGFMGAIQSAYGYAQDLNESLNNIRIVTGKSADEMADFAKSANEAAKELNTTTTAYTDAALIFYQQGLDDDAVKERTDAVVKLANVTRQSADDVSSYMTAIWNNFADGSTSLEHFADVITALGAATASSSAEIAQGLEKFAAVGATVGLSYEYATSALATVVAQTRQSADIVGTAFKTLFARIQDLELGKTLDDGTDLGKYSKALDTIGVKIKDVNGEVRQMDDILDDIGQRWNTIDKATQIAVAQTVAGTRQYTQMIALFDNWDKFQSNLGVANNSEGTLQKQADIYAESWEAAQKRVKAAAESLYSTILDDKKFIAMTNAFAKVIESIEGLLKGLGGVGGAITLISGMLLNVFAYKVPDAIDKARQNFKVFTGQAKQDTLDMQNALSKELRQMSPSSEMEKKEIEGMEKILSIRQTLLKNTNLFNEEEKNLFDLKVKQTEELYKELQLQIKLLQVEKERLDAENKKISHQNSQGRINELKARGQQLEDRINTTGSESVKKAATKELENINIEILRIEDNIARVQQRSTEIFSQSALSQFGKDLEYIAENQSVDVFFKKFQEGNVTVQDLLELLDKVVEKKALYQGDANETNSNLRTWKAEIKNISETTKNYDNLIQKLDEYIKKRRDSLTPESQKTVQTNSQAKYADYQKDYDSKDTRLAGRLATIKALGEEEQRVANSANQLADTMTDKLRGALSDNEYAFDDTREKAEGLHTEMDGLKTDSEVASRSVTEVSESIAKMVNERTNATSVQLTSFASTVMMVSQNISSLSNLMGTFMDESATGMQKVTSAAGVLVSTMFLLGRAYKSLNDSNSALYKSILKVVSARKAEAVATGEVLISLGALLAIYAAIAAIVLVVAYNIEKEKKARERNAEAQRKELELQEERKKALQDEKDNLDNLLISYDELLKKKEKQEISDKELSEQVYNLCVQYDQEYLAIKSLSGQYEVLRDAIKAAREESANELMNSSQATIDAAGKAAKGNILESVSGTHRKSNYINLKGLGVFGLGADGSAMPNEENLKTFDILQEAGLDIDQSGHANLDQLKDLALDKKGRDAIQKAVEQEGSASEQLNEILEATAEEYQKAQEARESYVEGYANSKYMEDSIKTLQEYRAAYNDVVEEVSQSIFGESFGDLSSEDQEACRNKANKIFNEMSSEFSKLGAENSLINLILGFDGNTFSEAQIVSALSNLPEEVIKAIAGNINIFEYLLEDSGNLQTAINKFTDKFGHAIEVEAKTSLSDGIKEALTSDSIGKKEINNLYEKGLDSVLKINQSEFESLNTGEKKLRLLEAQIAVEKEITEEKKAQVGEDQKTYDEIKAADDAAMAKGFADAHINTTVNTAEGRDRVLSDIENRLDTFEKELNSKYDNQLTPELIEKFLEYSKDESNYELNAELEKALNKEFNVSKDELIELKKRYEEITGAKVEDYKATKDLIDQHKTVKQRLDDLSQSIANNKGAVTDWAKELKNAEELVSEFNKQIDEIQSSYKTLMTAFQEYSADGYLTVDTYQALMNMSPQYLACLVNEKGQIDINKEAIKQATIANYEYIASSKMKQLELDLERVLEDSTAAETILMKYATDEATLANWNLTDAVDANIQALIKQGTYTEAQVENFRRYRDAILAAKDAGIKGLNTDFDAAMGVGKRGSEKDKKDLKKYDDEFDRYHDIKEVLEELADAISDVEKQQKHLYGKELARSLREENSLLEQQEAAYRELGAQQKQEQSELVASLGSMGVAFDQTSGQITNYAQATAIALQTLNDAITAYNASAQTEADKKILETAQKNYDEFKKKLERYDTLIEEIRDTENKLDDLFYKKLENNLKAWEAEIKFTLDIRDAEKTWKKFVNTMNEDFKSMFKDVRNQLKGLAEQANDLIKKSGTIDVRMGAMQDIEGEIDKLMAGEESSMFASVSEAQEKLKEYMKDLQSDAEELFSTYKEAWNAYLDGIDQAIDRFDDLNNQYERLDDNLNHQATMIELLYGEKAYNYLDELYNAESNSLLGQLDSLNKQIEFYKSQYEDAASKWGADSEAANKWKEAWQEAIDTLHDKEEAYIEAIQNKAKNAIANIFDDLDKKLSGGKGMENLQQHWQDALAAAEDYYDEVERVYEIDRIENLYKQAISDSSDLKTQQRLAAIMDDQVGALENKTKLSKYDIELAEKRLQVYQAQIALEEAQNNKTSMKVTRGEDGNWSYQYVADEEDVADKQQALLDKQNELYEFTKTKWQELQGEIVDLTSEAFSRIQELEQEALTASTERQAEIADEIAYLQEYYWGDEGLITGKIKQSGEVQRNVNEETANLLWTLYDIDLENYTRMNEKEQALIDQLVTNGVNGYETLYDTVFHCYEDIQSLTEDLNAESINTWTEAAAEVVRLWNSDDGDSIRFNIQDALEQCSLAVQEYNEDVKAGCEAAGEDFTAVSERIGEVQESVESLQGATDELVAQTISELAEYEAYVRQCEAAWESMKNALVDAMNTAIEYLNKVGEGISRQISNMRQLQQAANEAFAAAQRAAAVSPGGGGGGSVSSAQYWTQSDRIDPNRGGKYNPNVKATEDGRSEAAKLAANINTEDYYKIYKGRLSNVASTYGIKFASGGYTGDWHGDGSPDTDDGKLAWLHQKELVLNESDTSNILKVVDIVRNMGQTILGGLSKRFSGFDASNINNNNTEETSNTFNITAEFPNANNVDDIREAILSLPNLVSQYTNRK